MPSCCPHSRVCKRPADACCVIVQGSCAGSRQHIRIEIIVIMVIMVIIIIMIVIQIIVILVILVIIVIIIIIVTRVIIVHSRSSSGNCPGAH